MGFNKFIPPRCDVCGKFIGWMEFMMDRVHMVSTFDSPYTGVPEAQTHESVTYTHKKCLNNAKR